MSSTSIKMCLQSTMGEAPGWSPAPAALSSLSEAYVLFCYTNFCLSVESYH